MPTIAQNEARLGGYRAPRPVVRPQMRAGRPGAELQGGAANRQGTTGNNLNAIRNLGLGPGQMIGYGAPTPTPVTPAAESPYAAAYKASLAKQNSAIMAQLDQALSGIRGRHAAAMDVIATLPTTVAENYKHAQDTANAAAMQSATGLTSDVKIDPAVGREMQAVLQANQATSAASSPFLQLAAAARRDEGLNSVEAQRAAASAQSAEGDQRLALAQMQHQWDVEAQNANAQRDWQNRLAEDALGYGQMQREATIRRGDLQFEAGLRGTEKDPYLDEPVPEYAGVTRRAIQDATRTLSDQDIAAARSGDQKQWDKLVLKYGKDDATMAALLENSGGMAGAFGGYWQGLQFGPGGGVDPKTGNPIKGYAWPQMEASQRGGVKGETSKTKNRIPAPYNTMQPEQIRRLANMGDRGARSALAAMGG